MTALVIVLIGLALLATTGVFVALGWCADTRDPAWTAGPLLDRPHAGGARVR